MHFPNGSPMVNVYIGLRIKQLCILVSIDSASKFLERNEFRKPSPRFAIPSQVSVVKRSCRIFHESSSMFDYQSNFNGNRSFFHGFHKTNLKQIRK